MWRPYAPSWRQGTGEGEGEAGIKSTVQGSLISSVISTDLRNQKTSSDGLKEMGTISTIFLTCFVWLDKILT